MSEEQQVMFGLMQGIPEDPTQGPVIYVPVIDIINKNDKDDMIRFTCDDCYTDEGVARSFINFVATLFTSEVTKIEHAEGVKSTPIQFRPHETKQ